MVTIIVGWFGAMVWATPDAPEAAVVTRLTEGLPAEISVTEALRPRVPVTGSPDRWLVGQGTVRAGFAEAGPLVWRDLGGTLAFEVPSARILSVEGVVLRLEDASGQPLDLPADVSALQRQLDIELTRAAVVGGILREADARLLGHLRSRLQPLGLHAEALPAGAAAR